MSTGLRFEDLLDGASNYNPWKERMAVILEVNDLWKFASTTVTSPTDATLMAAHKKDVNAKRIILDAVKDHIISHLSGKKIAREMWETLTKLYQSDNRNRKMVSRD